jgi:hypothetical protein
MPGPYDDAMTPDELLARRLAQQLLASPATCDPAEVVAHLGAVQAQDYGQSLWAVGLRTRAATVSTVEAAIEHGTILRTWPMRGTIHLVPAEDARWMVQLLAGRRAGQMAGVHQKIGLTEAILGRSADIVSQALSNGSPIMRRDLYAILTEKGIDCSGSYHGSRGGHILSYLSIRGLICLGPLAGRQPTFVLLEEWAPAPRTPADPIAELVVRYFTSHGPATAKDMGWWSGLTLAEIRQAADRAGAALVAEDFGGEIYWRGAGAATAALPDGVHLLPAFDEYTVAYSERVLMLGNHPLPRGDLLNPVMVLDGRVVGLWKAAMTRSAVRIRLAPLDRAARREADSFRAAAERYAEFLGLRAEISLGPVDDVQRLRPGP